MNWQYHFADNLCTSLDEIPDARAKGGVLQIEHHRPWTFLPKKPYEEVMTGSIMTFSKDLHLT